MEVFFFFFLNLSLCKLHGTLHSEVLSEVSCSGVTGGRGEDRVPPPPPILLTGKFLLTYREKEARKRKMEQKRRKIEKGKVEN